MENKFLTEFLRNQTQGISKEGIPLVYISEKFGLTYKSDAYLKVQPETIYLNAAKTLQRNRPDELIFSIDRYALTGQGIPTQTFFPSITGTEKNGYTAYFRILNPIGFL
jgi:hypothetical protein